MKSDYEKLEELETSFKIIDDLQPYIIILARLLYLSAGKINNYIRRMFHKKPKNYAEIWDSFIQRWYL